MYRKNIFSNDQLRKILYSDTTAIYSLNFNILNSQNIPGKEKLSLSKKLLDFSKIHEKMTKLLQEKIDVWILPEDEKILQKYNEAIALLLEAYPYFLEINQNLEKENSLNKETIEMLKWYLITTTDKLALLYLKYRNPK